MPVRSSIIIVAVIGIAHLLSCTYYLGGFDRNLAAALRLVRQLKLNLEERADQCFFSLPELCFLTDMQDKFIYIKECFKKWILLPRSKYSSYLKFHILSLKLQLLTIFSKRQLLSYRHLIFIFTHHSNKTLFYTVCFTLLCFNPLYLYTPLLNLYPLIFGLTPFGCVEEKKPTRCH